MSPKFYALCDEELEEQSRYDPNYPTNYERIVQEREREREQQQQIGKRDGDEVAGTNIHITQVLPLEMPEQKAQQHSRSGEEVYESRKRLSSNRPGLQDSLAFLICNLQQLISQQQTAS
uniref:Cytoplasmic dynein 1 heavy chain 1 n=1 Tax=Lygus hesperus TaxID=30085 RepID=A0A0A9WCF7_LYGHE